MTTKMTGSKPYWHYQINDLIAEIRDMTMLTEYKKAQAIEHLYEVLSILEHNRFEKEYLKGGNNEEDRSTHKIQKQGWGDDTRMYYYYKLKPWME